MQSHKEMFEALLAGETLLSISTQEYKLIEGKVCVKHPNEDTWSIYSYGFPHYENVEIKKRTININGFEVPEPERVAPKEGTPVFIPAFDEDLFSEYTYLHAGISYDFLKHGVLHLTKEAAIAHANALLSFTKKEEE